MPKTPPEIDRHDTHKNCALQKWLTLWKNALKSYPICQVLSWVIFKSKFLNLLYDSESWSWDFKNKFFPLQSDILLLSCV